MCELKEEVRSRRKGWRKWMQPKIVSSISFVRFELHQKHLVGIRKRDDVPPPSRKDEYRYNPCPADLVPPIGAKYLMHIYHRPGDGEGATECINRFPKRVQERLAFTSKGPQIGWGIHFVEGLDMGKICIFGFCCALASTALGVLWAVLGKDVQGGFGMSAYMMVLFTLGLGSLQTYYAS